MIRDGQGYLAPLKPGEARRWSMWANILLAGVCAASAGCVGLQVGAELRAVLVLIGLTFGTGWAITGWLDIASVAYAGTVAVCVGAGVLIVSGMAFVEVHWWHPLAVSVVLLLMGMGGNVAQAIWKARSMR